MTPIIESSVGCRFLLMNLLFLIKTGTFILFIWQVTQRRRVLYLAICVLHFSITQMIYGLIRSLHYTVYGIKYFSDSITMFYQLPLFLFIIVTVVLGLWFAIIVRQGTYWKKQNITPMSINESLNDFPRGICFYYKGGMPCLVNRTMNDLSFILMGKGLTDGNEFYENLRYGKIPDEHLVIQNGDNPIVKLLDGRVISFQFEQIPYENSTLNELYAIEITEEYEKLQELKKDREKMLAINKRLQEYSKSVVEVNIAKEIHAAKVRIHDELGYALIVSKKYLGEGKNNRTELLKLWKKNITLLKEERAEAIVTDYDTIYNIAKCADINFYVEGELPKEPENIRKIVLTAMSECLTNTYRHAQGKEIYVRISYEMNMMILEITNNGNLPNGEIVEGSGLSGLRKMIEHEGGNMMIKSRPVFLLTIMMSI